MFSLSRSHVKRHTRRIYVPPKRNHGLSKIVSYYDNGDTKQITWYLNRIEHRINGPATTTYDNDATNRLISLFYFYRGNIHRTNGPAYLLFEEHIDNVFSLKREGWFKLGFFYRLGGPSDVVYYSNGNAARESWYINVNKKKHNIFGPAYVEYEQNGNKTREIWYCRDGHTYTVI